MSPADLASTAVLEGTPTLWMELFPAFGAMVAVILNNKCSSDRRTYMLRLIGIIIVMATLSAVAAYLDKILASTSEQTTYFLRTVFTFLLGYFSTERVRDLGLSKWLALVMMVPYLNIVSALVLAFVPRRPA